MSPLLPHEIQLLTFAASGPRIYCGPIMKVKPMFGFQFQTPIRTEPAQTAEYEILDPPALPEGNKTEGAEHD